MVNPDLPNKDNTPKSIFNPLKEDFVTSIRDDQNIQHDYIVPSMQIATFPTYIANIVIKKLVTAVKNKRGLGYLIPEDEQKIKGEIEI